MRRWNGWGDEAVDYPLPAAAAAYLERLAGPGRPAAEARFEDVVRSAPPSRMLDHPLASTDPGERLIHARGQSLPDWIALRTGRIQAFPDAVACPAGEEEVQALLGFARRAGFTLIPYGGGTSVVGHINPLPGERPVLTIDLSRLDRLTGLDETGWLATCQAGASGPVLERQLNARGYTLGHFPQSFELSTLGGWIATRSSGQQSYYYGRIEDLFAGGRLETLEGPLDLPVLPASAAGPDLRQMVLGSEGRLGIITRAVVRVRPLPEREAFYGVFFRDWESGAATVRQIAQERVPVSMVRLSDPQETETTLALSGKERLVGLAGHGLERLGYRAERSLMIFGATGNAQAVRQARRQAQHIARLHGGLFTGEIIGKIWRKSRFRTPYLRNTLWELGYALDTLETALPWPAVLPAAAAIQAAIREQLARTAEDSSAGGLVFAHLSHVYPDGASLYVTFLFPLSSDPDRTLERWQAVKSAASQAIQDYGGTISHQHGVGTDHAPYLPVEKGPAGMALLGAACRALDPEGLLNPGKLLTDF